MLRGICHVWQSNRDCFSQGAQPMPMRTTRKSTFHFASDRIFFADRRISFFFSFWNRQICQCKNEYIQNTVVGNTSVCIGTIPCGVDERVNFAAIFLVNNFKRFSKWKIWLQQNARMRLNQFSNKLCQCWSWAYFCISCNTFHK